MTIASTSLGWLRANPSARAATTIRPNPERVEAALAAGHRDVTRCERHREREHATGCDIGPPPHPGRVRRGTGVGATVGEHVITL